MNRVSGFLLRLRPWWLAAWPLWTLLVFASLAAVRFLPGGYVRSLLAVPVLLAVPGVLTLGAVFSPRRPASGAALVCLAALLSVLWSVFASLALYVLHVRITADSTFWCLLAICAALALAAQARLRGRRAAERRRVARARWGLDAPAAAGVEAAGADHAAADHDEADHAAADAAAAGAAAADADAADADAGDRSRTPAAVGRATFYAIAAVVAGLLLLAGGAYAVDHVPDPAPAGYTWMAWTGPPVPGVLPISATGTELPFSIVHRQPGTDTFRLSAVWLGEPSHPLAGPLTFSIGPDRTFHGHLFVPPLRTGCTYRLVITLTDARPVRQPKTWSINADVREPGRSLKTCQ